MFPATSTPTLVGPNSLALRAGPPSPENPGSPVPAIVVMMPFVSTLRTTL
jgi:hypothetical protein